MDSHSKHEVLEIFNMNKKNVFAGFLFLNPPPICQLFAIFSRMVPWYITTYKHNIYTFKFLRMEFFIFIWPNFIFNSTICAEGIANKSFFTGKPIRASLLELLTVVKALRSSTLYVKVE